MIGDVVKLNFTTSPIEFYGVPNRLLGCPFLNQSFYSIDFISEKRPFSGFSSDLFFYLSISLTRSGSLNFYLFRLGNSHLRVQNHHIPFSQHEIPVRDHYPVFAFDEHDHGMA